METQAAAISNKTEQLIPQMTLLKALPQAALLTDIKGNLLFANRPATRLLGSLQAHADCNEISRLLGLSQDFVCMENPSLRQVNQEGIMPWRFRGEVENGGKKRPVTVEMTLVFEENNPQDFLHLLMVHPPSSTFTLPEAKEVAPLSDLQKHFQSDATPILLADLEKQRQQSRQLEDELNRWQQAMEISETGLWEWDLATQKLTLSPVCLTQLGYDASKRMEHQADWEALLFQEDLPRMRRIWQSVAEGHSDRYSSEYRVLHANGSYVWIADKGRIVRNGHRSTPALHGTHENIHAKVMHALALTADNRQLQGENLLLSTSNNALSSSNQALTEFVHIASHDLQSPLRKIRQFIGLFAAKFNHLVDDQGQRYISTIVRTSDRMSSLIDDLMHYSSVHVNENLPGEVSLQEIIEELKSDMEEQNPQLSIQLPTQPLPSVHGHHSQMLQLFQNLISNGVKYNTNNEKRIVIEHRLLEDALLIRVKDNGIGIPADMQPKIFDLFYRGHGRNEYEGTGIGLAICKGIVQKMGGELSVQSAEGEGSCFFIKLPETVMNGSKA